MSLINKLLSFLEKGFLMILILPDLSVSVASILKLFTLYTSNTRAMLVTTHTYYFSLSLQQCKFQGVHFIDESSVKRQSVGFIYKL